MFGKNNKNKATEENPEISKLKLLEIENEQLSQRLSAFTEISQAIVGVIDSEQVFKMIADRLVKVLGISYASIWEWVPQTQRLQLRYVNAPQTAQIFATQMLGKSLGEAVFLNENIDGHKENIILKTLLEDKVLVTTDFEDLGRSFMNTPAAQVMETFLRMKEAVHIPLKAGNDKLGVLGLILNNEHADEVFIELAEGFASQVSTTVYNSKLFEQVTSQVDQLAVQNKTLSALYNLTSTIGQSLDPEEVSQAAVDALPQDEFLKGALISLHDSERNLLIPVAATTNDSTKEGLKLVGNLRKYAVNVAAPDLQEISYMKAFNSGVAKFSSDVEAMFASALPKVFVKQMAKIVSVKSIAVYPLQGHDRSFGVIMFFIKSHTAEELTLEQKQEMTTYSLQIGIAMENAQLYQKSQLVQKDLQKTLAELKEARRKERDMLDVMGHELRTPISIVRNALSMLRREKDKQAGDKIPEDKLERYLKMASDSTKREINLIETMLSATKVDGARLQLSFSKVDMQAMMDTAIEGYQSMAEKNGLDLEVVPPHEPIFGYADGSRAQEVIDNLISNAIKYTQQGKIVLKWWKGADFVWVSVTDTGGGIGEDDLANLGKKFFRAHQYTSHNEQQGQEKGGGDKAKQNSSGLNLDIVRPGGTGLGLYVSFELIRIMNGEIYINSIIGEGTTFTFSIPKFVSQPDKNFDAGSQQRQHIHLNEAAPVPPANTQITSHGEKF